MAKKTALKGKAFQGGTPVNPPTITGQCYKMESGVYVVKVQGTGALTPTPSGYFLEEPDTGGPVHLGFGNITTGDDYEVTFTIGSTPPSKFKIQIYYGAPSPSETLVLDWNTTHMPACP